MSWLYGCPYQQNKECKEVSYDLKDSVCKGNYLHCQRFAAKEQEKVQQNLEYKKSLNSSSYNDSSEIESLKRENERLRSEYRSL